MLPGFSSELMPKGREKESQAKIKRYMTMMDSMTNEGKQLLFMCFAFINNLMAWELTFSFSFFQNSALFLIANLLISDTELDSSNPRLMNDSRIMRIARGSGRQVREVMEMLEEYKRLAKIWSKMKGLKIPKKGEMSALSRNMNAQHMSKVLPQGMLKQIGGVGGLQNLMKQMGSTKDMMGMFGGGE